MELDILIKNGRVYDTSSNTDEVKSVGVKRNKIVDISGVDESSLTAERVIDAEGCYVFPGLIDFHAHVFYNGAPICVDQIPHFYQMVLPRWLMRGVPVGEIIEAFIIRLLRRVWFVSRVI